ncbi:MAG: hypothetical protein ACREXS_15375 [Gammaproteobacteria bacterium]
MKGDLVDPGSDSKGLLGKAVRILHLEHISMTPSLLLPRSAARGPIRLSQEPCCHTGTNGDTWTGGPLPAAPGDTVQDPKTILLVEHNPNVLCGQAGGLWAVRRSHQKAGLFLAVLNEPPPLFGQYPNPAE